MLIHKREWSCWYLNLSASSKGSSSSKTAWRCSPWMCADITLVFKALMHIPTAAAWQLTA